VAGAADGQEFGRPLENAEEDRLEKTQTEPAVTSRPGPFSPRLP
jgi:hypothetical protein